MKCALLLLLMLPTNLLALDYSVTVANATGGCSGANGTITMNQPAAVPYWCSPSEASRWIMTYDGQDTTLTFSRYGVNLICYQARGQAPSSGMSLRRVLDHDGCNMPGAITVN